MHVTKNDWLETQVSNQIQYIIFVKQDKLSNCNNIKHVKDTKDKDVPGDSGVVPCADARLRVQEVDLALLRCPLLCEQTPEGTIRHLQCEENDKRVEYYHCFCVHVCTVEILSFFHFQFDLPYAYLVHECKLCSFHTNEGL